MALAERRGPFYVDEYDAAQKRGELATRGKPKSTISNEDNTSTVADAGLTRKQIHTARQVRDAEEAEPGLVRRALDEALEGGDEPAKAHVRRSVLDAIKDAKTGP